VLADERLVENAAARGRQLVQGLEALKLRHPLIGDVRGSGLIVGVELVTDSATKSPASKDAHRVAYRCFELGLLVIYAGIYGNVIELTPPLSITEQEIDEALSVFDHALTDVEAGRFDDTKLDPYAGW
jgi:4-aminobutyrate aminotransferase